MASAVTVRTINKLADDLGVPREGVRLREILRGILEMIAALAVTVPTSIGAFPDAGNYFYLPGRSGGQTANLGRDAADSGTLSANPTSGAQLTLSADGTYGNFYFGNTTKKYLALSGFPNSLLSYVRFTADPLGTLGAAGDNVFSFDGTYYGNAVQLHPYDPVAGLATIGCDYPLDVRITGSGGVANHGLGVTGATGFAPVFSDGTLRVISPTATSKGTVVRGAAAQSGNLQEWQTSASVVQALISSAGTIQTDPGADVTALILKSTNQTPGSLTANLIDGYSAGGAVKVFQLRNTGRAVFGSNAGTMDGIVRIDIPVGAAQSVNIMQCVDSAGVTLFSIGNRGSFVFGSANASAPDIIRWQALMHAGMTANVWNVLSSGGLAIFRQEATGRVLVGGPSTGATNNGFEKLLVQGSTSETANLVNINQQGDGDALEIHYRSGTMATGFPFRVIDDDAGNAEINITGGGVLTVGGISFDDLTSAFFGILQSATLTASRTWTLPNLTGTLQVLSGVQTSTATMTWSGQQTFSNTGAGVTVNSGVSHLYATGSFTIATGAARVLSRHLELTTTQRATLAGTATLRIT